MESIYNKIIETVEANKKRFEALGLPAPVTIDLYNAQPEAPEGCEFFTPALFIDYSVNWENGNNEIKRGKIYIDIHVIIDTQPTTANHSERQNEGLKKIQYYNLIAYLVEGLRTETVGTITQTAEEPRPIDFYNYHVLQFIGAIQKDLRPKLTPIKAKPIIKVNEQV